MKRKELFKKLKDFEKRQKEIKELKKKDNSIEDIKTIIIDCQSIENYYNPLSYEQEEISDELINYIDKMCYPIPLIQSITIQFIHCALNEEEREKLKNHILKHYVSVLEDKKSDLKINSIKSFLLFLFGTVMLGLSFWLYKVSNNDFINEFMSIVATFSLWETVDLFLLERNELKINYLNAGQQALLDFKFE